MFKKVLLLLLFPSLLFAQQKDTVAVRYSKNISEVNLKKNLSVLASDEYEGRETGKRGQKMAAEYIANQFKTIGIPAYKQNTYYQEFFIDVLQPSITKVSVRNKQYKKNKDYYSFSSQTEQLIETKEILFLGYGIEEENYNDYKNIDVKDKVIMVLANEPYSKDSLSFISGKKKPSYWTTYYKTKSEKAKEKGAKALLIVVDNIENELQKNKQRIESTSMKLDTDIDNNEMPTIYISKKMAIDIIKKQSIDKIKQSITETSKPINIIIKTKFVISIKNTVEKISSENVLGYIEGSDLKEELIVVSAHYDHLGIYGNAIFNGADDDGSGTVAVIELAKVFAQAKKEGKGPRRSMLFITFSGEEKGLLGSSFYVAHPEFPLANTVCDLNIDMIGRLDAKHQNTSNYVYLIGSDKLSAQLHNISETTNKTYSNLELDYTYNDEKDKNRFYYRSDHYNFAKNRIPVIFYFNGVHADYHKETDEVEKIDFNKIEKITQFIFFTAWELANRNSRIELDSNKK